MLEQSHVISMGAAAATFFVMAGFITIPIFIYNYRKHGFVSKFRIFVLFTFLYYILTAFYLTILPLPSQNIILYKIKPQLIPFNAEMDIWINHKKLIARNITGIMLILKNRALWQVIFNFMLLMPLGFYLRYYFKKGVKFAVITSFCVSLFFEVTQLTGIYGIYNAPYRLFDVDDLILNTLGGVLGYYITPSISKILPDLDEINERYDYSQPVTYFRRALSFYLDLIIVSFVQKLLMIAFRAFNININIESNFMELGLIAFYYIAIQYLTKGYTLGKKVFKIRVLNDKDETPSFYAMFIRYFSILIFPMITYVLNSKSSQDNIVVEILFFTFLVDALFILLIIVGIFRKDKRMYHDIISKTHVINTFNKKEV